MGSFSKRVQDLRRVGMDSGAAGAAGTAGGAGAMMGVDEEGVQVEHGLDKSSKERHRVSVGTCF
jgi:hypothetical protein